MIITASVDPEWINEAQVLQRRGIRLICVYIDPQTFSAGRDSKAVRGMLQLAKIPTLTLSARMMIYRAALEQRPA